MSKCKVTTTNGVEIFNPFDYGIHHVPLMVPVHEYNRILGALGRLRASISDYGGHGNPGCPDRAEAYAAMAEADSALAGPASNQRVQPAATEPAEQAGRGPLGCDELLGADHQPERRP